MYYYNNLTAGFPKRASRQAKPKFLFIFFVLERFENNINKKPHSLSVTQLDIQCHGARKTGVSPRLWKNLWRKIIQLDGTPTL